MPLGAATGAEVGVSARSESRVLLVHGLKRSGNHAIINWIRGHGSFRFFNNVIPIAPILRGERRIPERLDFEVWLRRQVENQQPRRPRLRDVVRGRRSMRLDDPAMATSTGGADDRAGGIIVSVEDHPPDLVPFAGPRDLTHVLVLRDPANLFASRVRKARKVVNPAYAEPYLRERLVPLWKSYAREFIGTTRRLDPLVGVHFDTWFADELYRRRISEQLGLAFDDTGFGRVSREGGGSSFDGTQYDGAAARMDVLDRYSRLSQPERALVDGMLDDVELTDLAEQARAQASRCCTSAEPQASDSLSPPS